MFKMPLSLNMTVLLKICQVSATQELINKLRYYKKL